MKAQEVTFVVVSLGYWGKGETLKEAAVNCVKSGGTMSDKCVAYCYVGERAGETTVDSCGNILYHAETVQSIRLFGPGDSKIKISHLI